MSVLPSFGAIAHQTCQVFETSAFRVVLGANFLDAADHAHRLVMGDVYNLHSEARSKTLIHAASTVKTENGERGFQVVAPGSEIGTPGTRISAMSRLTFMSDDSTISDVLVLSLGDLVCIHPLRPLRPRFDYTLLKSESNAGFAEFATVGMVSLARGTNIEMADGTHARIEDLRPGMALRTRDNGAQKISSISFQTVSADSEAAPVVVPRGQIGNKAELLLSPEYPLYLAITAPAPGVLATETITLAKRLIDDEVVYQRKTGVVDYFQIRMPDRAIIFAEGVCVGTMNDNLPSIAKPARMPRIDRDRRAAPQIGDIGNTGQADISHPARR